MSEVVSEVVGKEWYRLIVLQKKDRVMVYGSAGGWMVLGNRVALPAGFLRNNSSISVAWSP